MILYVLAELCDLGVIRFHSVHRLRLGKDIELILRHAGVPGILLGHLVDMLILLSGVICQISAFQELVELRSQGRVGLRSILGGHSFILRGRRLQLSELSTRCYRLFSRGVYDRWSFCPFHKCRSGDKLLDGIRRRFSLRYGDLHSKALISIRNKTRIILPDFGKSFVDILFLIGREKLPVCGSHLCLLPISDGLEATLLHRSHVALCDPSLFRSQRLAIFHYGFGGRYFRRCWINILGRGCSCVEALIPLLLSFQGVRQFTLVCLEGIPYGITLLRICGDAGSTKLLMLLSQISFDIFDFLSCILNGFQSLLNLIRPL